MWAPIQHAVDDIRRGENIDLYLGITLSLLVGALGILGIANSDLVSSLVLAVLALVCYTFVTQRRQNSQIVEMLAAIHHQPTAADFLVEHDLAAVQKLVAESESVWLRGVSLQSNIPIFEDSIGRGLKLGRTYRALLTDPCGTALELAARRWPSFKREDFVRDLAKNISRLRYLKDSSTKGTLEVRLIDDLGPYLIYIFNAGRADGALMVRLPSLGPNDERPTFWIYNKRDPYWFGRFVAEFEHEWDRASSGLE